jgi:hypothetical protein
MVTASGSMRSKSKLTRLHSIQPLIPFSTCKSKMENAPDIKSKSFEKVLKNRLVCFDAICHFHPTQSALRTPIHTIKRENLFRVKMK